MKRTIPLLCVIISLLFTACGEKHEPTTCSGTPTVTISFDTYDDYFLFFQTGGHQGTIFDDDGGTYCPYCWMVWGSSRNFSDIEKPCENCVVTQAYIDSVSGGEKSMVLPYLDGSLLPINSDGGNITFMPRGTYEFSWTWIDSLIGDDRIIVCIADIPEEHQSLAQSATASQFLAEVYPSAPNVGSFSKKYYTAVSETDCTVGGTAVRALISEVRDSDTVYTKFIIDGTLVSIKSFNGMLPQEWLSQLSFRKVSN